MLALCKLSAAIAKIFRFFCAEFVQIDFIEPLLKFKKLPQPLHEQTHTRS